MQPNQTRFIQVTFIFLSFISLSCGAPEGDLDESLDTLGPNQLISGQIETVIYDGFDSEESWRETWIQTREGELLQVLPGDLLTLPKSQSTVVLWGRKGNGIFRSERLVESTTSPEQSKQKLSLDAGEEIVAQRRILIIPLWHTKSTPPTEQALRERLIDGSDSIAARFKYSSSSKEDPFIDILPAGTFTVKSGDNVCNYGFWKSKGTQYIQQFGTRAAGYDNYAIIIPSILEFQTCGWNGKASISGQWSVAHYSGSKILENVMVHEIGHNLGLQHAGRYDCDFSQTTKIPFSDEFVSTCGFSEYGDYHSFMGNGPLANGYGAHYRSFLEYPVEQAQLTYHYRYGKTYFLDPGNEQDAQTFATFKAKVTSTTIRDLWVSFENDASPRIAFRLPTSINEFSHLIYRLENGKSWKPLASGPTFTFVGVENGKAKLTIQGGICTAWDSINGVGCNKR